MRSLFTPCSRLALAALVAALLPCAHAGAQKLAYAWDPTGMLVLGVGGGVTKYFGEFTDQHFGGALDLHAKYFIIPEVGVQINGGYGSYTYNRRMMVGSEGTYVRQFYRDPQLKGLNTTPFPTNIDELILDPAMRKEVLEHDKLSYFEGRALVNLFPKERVNPYFSIGAGVTTYSNGNAETTLPDGVPLLNVTFNNAPFVVDLPDGSVSQAQPSTLPDGANTVVTLPLGIGFDWTLTEQVGVNLDVSYRFLFGEGKDMMDGFGRPVQENFNAAGRVDRVKSIENPDSWLSVSIGVQAYLFGQHDRDDDGLSDGREADLGTDPLNPDTDGDGLTDGQEAEVYATDPLKTDTDGDRLTDAEEIAKGTNPVKPDTDGDGLGDGDELSHGTDPFTVDSDKDGLTDGEEVHVHHSDPLKTDSDLDGIEDREEALSYHTDPRSADSDKDGLGDAREVSLGTNPAAADTDGDGLSDGDEVGTYNTDPKNPDTDGDGLKDGDEVARAADPHVADTDGDGIPDGRDQCPDKAENVNGYRDEDGCPDSEPLSRAPLAAGQVFVLHPDFRAREGVLTPHGEEILQPLAQSMREQGALRVRITVHGDGTGKAASALETAKRHAEGISFWLHGQGFTAERFDTEALGNAKPLARGRSAAARAKNDRVEITILSVE
jgi:hypothetical protein